MKQLRILADLRECQEGFSGIAVDTCRIFRTLNELENVQEVGGLLISQKALAFQYQLARSLEEADSYLKQAQYLSSLEFSDKKRLRQKIFDSLGEFKAQISLNWLFQRKFSINPIDKHYYSEFIWQTYFANTMPSQDYSTLLKAQFFGSRMCYPLARFRASRFLLNPSLDTSGWDVFFTSTPMNIKVSKGTKKIVRYHDAIPVFYPHLTPNPPAEQYKQLKECALDAASFFVCNSSNTRQELLTLFPQVEQRSTVISCSVSDNFFKTDDQPQFEEIIKNYSCFDSVKDSVKSNVSDDQSEYILKQFSGRYLICVSTIDPRKNYRALIQAWAEVRASTSPDLNLVIVGRVGWKSEEILNLMRPYVLEGSLVHLTSVPFASLRMLLSNALAYVFPTLAEGFGIPPIEAMRCGCPTIVSNINIMKETCGDAALFVNPYDVKEIAGAINSLIRTNTESKSLRCDLITKGYIQSEQFTIDKCKQKWEIYLENM